MAFCQCNQPLLPLSSLVCLSGMWDPIAKICIAWPWAGSQCSPPQELTKIVHFEVTGFLMKVHERNDSRSQSCRTAVWLFDLSSIEDISKASQWTKVTVISLHHVYCHVQLEEFATDLFTLDKLVRTFVALWGVCHNIIMIIFIIFRMGQKCAPTTFSYIVDANI